MNQVLMQNRVLILSELFIENYRCFENCFKKETNNSQLNRFICFNIALTNFKFKRL
jgi:hypothetical protein